MLKQFKGLKWINNIPCFLLFDLNSKKIEIKKIGKNVNITKTNKRLCNGYYDLLNRKYVVCKNLEELSETENNQCNCCKELSGFSECLGCDGKICRANNKMAQKFCNQEHIVYIALFGNDRFKVGTAAEYRKYSRILEQGAIASMFIAETPNGRLARLIEHKIGQYGYTLQVQSSYKIQNLVIEKSKNEIKEILEKKYKEIKEELPLALRQYMVSPKINYCEKINETNKKYLLKENPQLSLFDEIKKSKNYDFSLQSDTICGSIVNIVGTMLILNNNKIHVYDTKKLEGWIVDINM